MRHTPTSFNYKGQKEKVILYVLWCSFFIEVLEQSHQRNQTKKSPNSLLKH